MLHCGSYLLTGFPARYVFLKTRKPSTIQGFREYYAQGLKQYSQLYRVILSYQAHSAAAAMSLLCSLRLTLVSYDYFLICLTKAVGITNRDAGSLNAIKTELILIQVLGFQGYPSGPVNGLRDFPTVTATPSSHQPSTSSKISQKRKKKWSLIRELAPN